MAETKQTSRNGFQSAFALPLLSSVHASTVQRCKI